MRCKILIFKRRLEDERLCLKFRKKFDKICLELLIKKVVFGEYVCYNRKGMYISLKTK